MEQTSFFLLIFLKYKKKRLNNTKQLLITLNNFGHVRLLNFWVFRGRLLDVALVWILRYLNVWLVERLALFKLKIFFLSKTNIWNLQLFFLRKKASFRV